MTKVLSFCYMIKLPLKALSVLAFGREVPLFAKTGLISIT